MISFVVHPSKIAGVTKAPPSKSHSMRAILLASMAEGKSSIYSYLNSPDIWAMVGACQAFGAHIQAYPKHLEIEGVGGRPRVMQDVVHAGNSGQVLRFIGAMAGLIEGYTIITGDASLRYQRPLAPLISGLEQLGCFAVSAKSDGYAPLIVRGTMQGGDISIDGADSQPVSGLMMAACFAKYTTNIRVLNAGELPWIGLTLGWLDKLGLHYQAKMGECYSIPGGQTIKGFAHEIAGDFSSAAFLLVGAAIARTNICIRHLNMDDMQGDKAILTVLVELGFKFQQDDCAITFLGENQGFPGFHLDLNCMIDALPILAVLACFAETPSVLTGASIARAKESDRISVMTQELQKMGAHIEEFPDGMKIWPAKLQGRVLNSHQDHRIAMALCIAAMAAQGPSKIDDVACVEKSFPNFARTLVAMGGRIEVK